MTNISRFEFYLANKLVHSENLKDKYDSIIIGSINLISKNLAKHLYSQTMKLRSILF